MEQEINQVQSPAAPHSVGEFSAFITNLGKYNEGRLVGEWVEFPTTREAIQEVFRRIGVDGIRYEEYFITDYDVSNEGIYNCLGEYTSVNELNYLATLISKLGTWETDAFYGALDLGDASSVQDLINLTQNLDCYSFLPGVEDEYDLGYYWIEESGCYSLGDAGVLANYIDYERFGRDVAMDENGAFVAGGYIYNTGDSMTEIYDGMEVPDEYRVFSFPPAAVPSEKAQGRPEPEPER